MKKSLRPFLIFFILFSMFVIQEAAAQNGNNDQAVIVGHPRPNIMLYLGAGFNNPSTKIKNDVNIANNIGFSAGLFIPILKRANYSFGFSGETEYFSSNNQHFNTLPQPFKVQGASSVTVNQNISESPKTSGSILGIAPQINFFIGNHFIFSPMFEIGYLNVTGKSFTATQTTIVGEIEYNHVLLSENVNVTSGLATIPKVRMSYMFSRNMGLWLEANYMLGPTTESTITTLVPEPEPDDNGEYNIEQLNHGTNATEQKTTKFNSIGLKMGLVFAFGTAHHIPKIPKENQSNDNNDKQVCQNLKVEIKKVPESDPVLYSLVITNNYAGTNVNYKPKSFTIKIKENAVTKIEEPISAGWSRTPSSIPPNTKDVSWNSSSFVPNGETKLGKLRFATLGTKQFTVVYEWRNKNQNTICKDSISFNDSKYYYDLKKETNNYTEVFDKLLNIQFSNEYATSDNLELKIYDVKTKKLVNRKSDKSLNVNSLNGLNRISIDLKDYQLEQGALYLLIVSDSNINYNFNFKITDKITNDREK
jgi:hypothetical protein